MLDTRPVARDTRGVRGTVQPTGQERTFGNDELIVSKTDPRGVITYANDVFLRVSGFRMEAVLGQPHSLIRHPGMPRAIFRLLWDTLGNRQEIFAYINNLAADGAHYWVLAHVTPSFGLGGAVIGYHSNRRSPSPRAVASVQPLYDRLLTEERRHSSAKAAVAASYPLLTELIAEQADCYDEFIWSIIGKEER